MRVRSPTSMSQANELLRKILAYNITVPIHEMFERGIRAAFLRGGRDGEVSPHHLHLTVLLACG